MSDVDPEELASLNDVIATLGVQLEQARLIVKQWTNASTQLARSAAKVRAETQGMGRGIGGALLGSKFRSTMRSAAVRENARIAKEVAEKRAKNSKGKMEAQELVRRIQVELNLAKERRKSLIALAKTQSKTKANTGKPIMPAQSSSQQRTTAERLSELEQLRKAGIVREEEYGRKREEILRDL